MVGSLTGLAKNCDSVSSEPCTATHAALRTAASAIGVRIPASDSDVAADDAQKLGGIKPGVSWGETCEYGYNVARDGVHVHDFHATLLRLLGIDHERLPYNTCGVLCFGFARAKCTSCGHGFLVAFSCKGRGVCPSCTGRRMAQTAAHLADHVMPPVPVRQWVISVPKRLRWVLADRPQAMTALSRIFLDEIEERVAAGRDVAFYPARPLSPADLATVTQRVRRRLVRWFRRKGFLSREAAADMLAWRHSGFSVDASVRISPSDHDVPAYFRSLEHLLRYCARPAFALERLSAVAGRGDRADWGCYTLPRHKRGDWVGPGRTRKSTRPGTSGVVELPLFEFLDRLAAFKAVRPRHLTDRLGAAVGSGGRSVSPRVRELRRRHPADQFHHPAGDDSENSDAPG